MSEKFQGKINQKTSINDLIVLALYLLEKKKENIGFEKLLEKCFKLAPQLISFKEHNWPDSRKLSRPLRSLREERLIQGNPKTSFSLTKKGKEEALRIKKKLYQGKLL